MSSSSDGAPPVNSPQWWEDYFQASWDANGGAEQTRHFMQRLIAELPAPEAARLRRRPTILDWGCAHGEGVDELARTFPGATVSGIDVAATAVAEARRRFPAHEFSQAADGEVPRADVVVCSNCLEHFASPWPVAERLARAANDLLILLVPCAEEPLCASHVVRFDEGSFPPRLGPLQRLAEKRIAVDARHWGGDQLLAVYGSPAYAAARALDEDGERAKWDAYYATTELEAESGIMARFGAEFADMVGSLLPAGGRVLEAGAGAGWHSLALARTGRFEVTLLDFSEQALRHARARFEREGQRATFVLGDAREHGEADHDLVFNSGVLEHFSSDEQVRFVRAMASRSRDLVLALVPNRRCYWYWLWRVQATGRGDWPFGKEMPSRGLGPVFAAAGLDVLGERVLGHDWTEAFFAEAIRPELREQLGAVHRSPLLDAEVKGYLLAAVGRQPTGPPRAASELGAGWQPAGLPGPPTEAELAGALADALSLQVMQSNAARAAQAAAAAAAAQEREHRRADLERLRAELHAAEERRIAGDATVGRLQAGLREATARGAQIDGECTRLREELGAATAARDHGDAERQRLGDELRAAAAAHEQLAGERDVLARECDDLRAFRAWVESSLLYRMRQRVRRWRESGRGRSGA